MYGRPTGEGTVAYPPDRPMPPLPEQSPYQQSPHQQFPPGQPGGQFPPGQPGGAQPGYPQQQPHHQPGYPQGQYQQQQPPPAQPSRHGGGPPEGQRPVDDPYRPFVTAGQISGPKTPPPERQQELWDTVFGDNYQAIGEEDDLGPRRPVWLFALASTVVVALIGVLAWAFIAGPLSSGDEGDPTAAAPKSSAKGKAPSTTKPQSLGKRLPTYSGTRSPVIGTVTDSGAGITLARLGGSWRLDTRTQIVTTKYGYDTRQYISAGQDSTGKTQFAQVLSGPLPKQLAAKYTSPGKLGSVISAVAYQARLKFFPEGNQIAKTATQKLTVGEKTGLLNVYEITAGETKTTVVVAALDAGGDLPSVVYMSVPDAKKALRPDINTVFKSLKPLS